jgi:serine/threonine protein kinase
LQVETQLNAQRYGNTIPIYGITKDPAHEDYMIVMDYAKEGSLRAMLDKHHSELTWKDKLQNLNYIAYALAGIHEANLIHKDLHSGNIVMTDLYNSWITDFGLCKPITDNKEKALYGVLPYIAPEVLSGGKHTEASDVYSFGIIMSEFLTGYPPYHDVAHDYDLALRICQGLKPIGPKIRRGVPKLLLNLMNKCLHIDPLERQSSGQVQNSVYHYLINCDKKFTKIAKQIETIENSNISYPKFDPTNCTKHPLTCYTSRLIDYKNKLKKVYSGIIIFF